MSSALSCWKHLSARHHNFWPSVSFNVKLPARNLWGQAAAEQGFEVCLQGKLKGCGDNAVGWQ